jgi:putative NADH-flavin reductase
MNIVLFGATGHIGRQILDQALARGHTVTAFVRDASKLDMAHPDLRVAEGDARDAQSVAAVMPGHDAVVSALGPGGPDVSDRYLDILTAGTRHLVDGMSAAGLRRIVALGSVATMNATPDTLLRDMPGFPAFARNISGAHLESLKALQASGLDWTVLCPAPVVEPGPRTGRYRVQADVLLVGDPQSTTISTGDAADFVLNEVERGTYIGHRVNIAY